MASFATALQACFDQLLHNIQTDQVSASVQLIKWVHGLSVYTDFGDSVQPGLCSETIETLCMALESESFADVE